MIRERVVLASWSPRARTLFETLEFHEAADTSGAGI
jgi:hypothetical protein